jgi:hypothetical protein
MRTGHYEEGYHLYEKVTNYPRFKDKQPQIVEMWNIFQAYIFYLIKVGKIREDVLSERSKKFKMSKFINDISLFTKDKRGMISVF